ncbi:hypothetical protein ABG768_018841 [Culter alburnus]|uniref:MADF domain-containing protein n=1 Tax=Culter alburnus TaxID=194366 RepID=A0AAW2AWM3_CULAL
MAGFWTNQKEEELVCLWEERPELYAVGVAAYTNRDARGNAVRSMATALGISEAEVKKKMESMRTQYSRYLKSPPSGSGGYHTPRQEWFLRRLKFLEMHIKKRPSTSNLDLQNDSTTSLEEGEGDDRGEDKEQEKEEEEQEREEEEKEKHQQNQQPPKNDGIYSFCQYIEQQLRAIEDPHHLQYVQFQIHQILPQMYFQIVISSMVYRDLK